MFLETKILAHWQSNFLFSTSKSHRQSICQNLKEAQPLHFFSFNLQKNEFICTTEYRSLSKCFRQFWHIQLLFIMFCIIPSSATSDTASASSSCSSPNIIPCTVLLVYDSLLVSHFHYHNWAVSWPLNLHYLYNYFTHLILPVQLLHIHINFLTMAQCLRSLLSVLSFRGCVIAMRTTTQMLLIVIFLFKWTRYLIMTQVITLETLNVLGSQNSPSN